jgi:hypothetical protein
MALMRVSSLVLARDKALYALQLRIVKMLERAWQQWGAANAGRRAVKAGEPVVKKWIPLGSSPWW